MRLYKCQFTQLAQKGILSFCQADFCSFAHAGAVKISSHERQSSQHWTIQLVLQITTRNSESQQWVQRSTSVPLIIAHQLQSWQRRDDAHLQWSIAR